MIQSKMIEKDEELHCSFNHNLPICAVVLDTKLQKNHTLLCSLCMENIESKAEVISFKKVLKDIEEIQAQKKVLVENVIMINIDQIEKVQKDLILLKSHVIQQLDEIIGGANEWIKQVLII